MSRSRADRLGRVDASIRSDLDVDPGPLDDDTELECRAECERAAVYRVPHPAGGDVALCPFHLAWYRSSYPQRWRTLVECDDSQLPSPEPYATRGDRFVSLDEAPPEAGLDGELVVAIALLQTGHVLFESDEPDDDGTVTYAAMTRSLEPVATTQVHASDAGETLARLRDDYGFLECDPEVRAALDDVTPALARELESRGGSP